MLHPSYTDLMKVVNQDVEEGDERIVNSRYSIVLATSKRARQLIDGKTPLVPTKPGQKPLSVAIDELNHSKIKIVTDDVKAEVVEELAEEVTDEAVETAEATDAVAEDIVEEAVEEAAKEETIEE